MAENDIDRREQATPKRREEARKKGHVAKSRDLSSALFIIAGIGAFYLLFPLLMTGLLELMKDLLSHSGSTDLTLNYFQGLILDITYRTFIFTSPIFIMLSIAAISSSVIQTGFLFALHPITPDLSRINPAEGFKRIFRKESIFELIKLILKILLVGYVAYVIVREEIPGLFVMVDYDLREIFYRFGRVTLRVSFWAGILILAIAVFDYLIQRWEYEKALRMTREEIREEQRETEGNPLIRSRIRSIQKTMARKRMMAELPKADVVITNPTHIAVALYYDAKKMPAPQVLAKGAGFIAERIKDLAREYRIPLVEDKPLAQALYKLVDIGDKVPSHLYKAVAEILAYVYKLKPNLGSRYGKR